MRGVAIQLGAVFALILAFFVVVETAASTPGPLRPAQRNAIQKVVRGGTAGVDGCTEFALWPDLCEESLPAAFSGFTEPTQPTTGTTCNANDASAATTAAEIVACAATPGTLINVQTNSNSVDCTGCQDIDVVVAAGIRLDGFDFDGSDDTRVRGAANNSVVGWLRASGGATDSTADSLLVLPDDATRTPIRITDADRIAFIALVGVANPTATSAYYIGEIDDGDNVLVAGCNLGGENNTGTNDWGFRITPSAGGAFAERMIIVDSFVEARGRQPVVRLSSQVDGLFAFRSTLVDLYDPESVAFVPGGASVDDIGAVYLTDMIFYVADLGAQNASLRFGAATGTTVGVRDWTSDGMTWYSPDTGEGSPWPINDSDIQADEDPVGDAGPWAHREGTNTYNATLVESSGYYGMHPGWSSRTSPNTGLTMSVANPYALGDTTNPNVNAGPDDTATVDVAYTLAASCADSDGRPTPSLVTCTLEHTAGDGDCTIEDEAFTCTDDTSPDLDITCDTADDVTIELCCIEWGSGAAEVCDPIVLTVEAAAGTPLPNDATIFDTAALAFFIADAEYLDCDGDGVCGDGDDDCQADDPVYRICNGGNPGTMDVTFGSGNTRPLYKPTDGPDSTSCLQFDGSNDVGSMTISPDIDEADGTDNAGLLVIGQIDNVTNVIAVGGSIGVNTGVFIHAMHLRTSSGDIYRSNGAFENTPHNIDYGTPEASGDTAWHLWETHAYEAAGAAMHDGTSQGALGGGGVNTSSGIPIATLYIGANSSNQYINGCIREVVLVEGHTTTQSEAYRDLRVCVEYPSFDDGSGTEMDDCTP